MKLSIDKLSTVTDICRNREVRYVSVLEFLGIVNFICETLVPTSKDYSYIYLLHSHSFFHVICSSQDSVEELKSFKAKIGLHQWLYQGRNRSHQD